MAARIVFMILAPGFLLAGLVHIILGPGADVMLGANLPAGALADATLDSQNRFYGAAFMAYGALFWIMGRDIPRYRVTLNVLIGFFFLGGLVRIVSILLKGWPSDLVWALALSELVLPPILWWLVARERDVAA